jgi:hypothetical protein
MIPGQYVVKFLIALVDMPLIFAFTAERSRHGHTWYAESATEQHQRP